MLKLQIGLGDRMVLENMGILPVKLLLQFGDVLALSSLMVIWNQ